MAKPPVFVARTLMQIMDDRAIMGTVLAHELGISKSAFSRKLNGSRPWTLDEMHRIAAVLNIPVDEVFPPHEYIPASSLRRNQ